MGTVRRSSTLALSASFAVLVGLAPPGIAPAAGPDAVAPGTATGSALEAVTTGGGCGVTISPVASLGLVNDIDLVVVGEAVTYAISTFDRAVVAVADGRPDLSFGSGGRAEVLADVVRAVATPDGGLLLAAHVFSGPRRVELQKVGRDGRPDAGYGDGGRTAVPLGGQSDGSAYAVDLEILPDGSTLLVSGLQGEATVAWLDDDGTGRDGFGDAGVARFPVDFAVPNNVVAMPDGSVMALADEGPEGSAWRVTSTGELDTTFGEGGRLRLDDAIGSGEIALRDTDTLLFADPYQMRTGTIDLADGGVDETGPLPNGAVLRFVDGGLVVVGNSDEAAWFGSAPLVVTRLLPTGAPDESFGDGGRVASDVSSTIRIPVDLMAGIGADGRVEALAAGTDWDSTPSLVHVAVGVDGQLRAAHGWCPDDDRSPAPTVVRLSGGDRYDTAVATSREAFADGAGHVLVATGTAFPDALAGGPAAAAAGGPVLLVPPGSLPDGVAAELRRLAPDRVTVLGGEQAVSEAVVAAIRAVTGVTPTRVAGGDRFETAVAISRATFTAGVPVAFVTTGQNFPDALAAGAVAGTLGGPVLLVSAGGVPPTTRAELQRLAPARIIVVGGPSAVGPTFEQLADAFPDVEVVAGGDRYATARAVVQQFREEYDGAHGRPVTTAFLATGRNFPDALAGAAVAGTAGGVILLVEPDAFDERVRDYLGRVDPSTIYVLGGRGAVGDVWVDVLRAPEATSYTYISEPLRPDRPIAWNPCAPIHWEFNPDGAPEGGQRFLAEALAKITSATGWQFAYDGETDSEVFGDGGGFEVRPVVMGWTEMPFGGAAGQAGPSWVSDVAIGGSLGLNVHMDSPLGFDDGDWGEVALHEMGHLLGLSHPGDAQQNMYWVGTGSDGITGLTPGDIAGLRRLREGGCRELQPGRGPAARHAGPSGALLP